MLIITFTSASHHPWPYVWSSYSLSFTHLSSSCVFPLAPPAAAVGLLRRPHPRTLETTMFAQTFCRILISLSFSPCLPPLGARQGKATARAWLPRLRTRSSNLIPAPGIQRVSDAAAADIDHDLRQRRQSLCHWHLNHLVRVDMGNGAT